MMLMESVTKRESEPVRPAESLIEIESTHVLVRVKDWLATSEIVTESLQLRVKPWLARDALSDENTVSEHVRV